jgi:hypothetical protein
MQKNSNITCVSYLNLTAASSHYQDNWIICDETWFSRLLNVHYPHLKNTFNFTREGLNRALSAKAGPFTGPNDSASSWQNSRLNARTLVIRGGGLLLQAG